MFKRINILIPLLIAITMSLSARHQITVDELPEGVSGNSFAGKFSVSAVDLGVTDKIEDAQSVSK